MGRTETKVTATQTVKSLVFVIKGQNNDTKSGFRLHWLGLIEQTVLIKSYQQHTVKETAPIWGLNLVNLRN